MGFTRTLRRKNTKYPVYNPPVLPDIAAMLRGDVHGANAHI